MYFKRVIMSTEFQFGKMKSSGGGWNNVNVKPLKCTLHKGYNGECHAYFTAIKKKSEYICDWRIIWGMWRWFSLCFAYSKNSSTLLPKQDMGIAITTTLPPQCSLFKVQRNHIRWPGLRVMSRSHPQVGPQTPEATGLN